MGTHIPATASDIDVLRCYKCGRCYASRICNLNPNSYATLADPGHGVTQVLPVLQPPSRRHLEDLPARPGADFGRHADGDCDMKARALLEGSFRDWKDGTA